MALSKIKSDSLSDNAAAGHTNLIINPVMAVAQRGDVTGKTSSTYGGPDRFRLGLSGAGTHSISQSSTAPDGIANSYKIDCTTADTTPTIMTLTHRIEGQNLQHLKKGTSSAEKLTLSFWVRSNVTGTYVSELRDVDNTRHIAATYSISTADTWEHKVITFAGDTSGALGDDNGNSLEVNWWLGASSTYTSGTLATSWASLTNANRAAGLNVNIAASTSNEWYITGVKLESGEDATPLNALDHDYGHQLQRCSRYYQQITYDGGSAVAIGFQSSTSGAQAVVYYPYGLMRAAPTITLPSAGQGASLMTFLRKNTGYPTTTGSHAGEKANTAQYFLTATGYAGLDGGGLGTWLYTGSSSGSITFKYDAEL